MNGNSGPIDLRAIAHQAMIDRGLEPDFPPDATQQVSRIQGPARESGNAIRDLRSLLWCSIDNDTSRDLDQLTVADKLSSGKTKVLVAIADVDAVIHPASPIDRHAAVNTTSVYTAAQIFPMLPEKLSTDLTSLGQGQDRLALVIEMTVAGDGTVDDANVYRALVTNRAKLAYRSVAAWLDGKDRMPEPAAKVQGMDEQLRIQDQVAQVMKKVRHLHGALELESLEPEAVIRDGKVVDLLLQKKNRAQELIEEFMIAGNGVSAQFLENHNLPSLRRIVRTPKRWDRICEVAQSFGHRLPDAPDAAALSAFLEKRRQADSVRFPDLSLTIVKLLGPGEYVLQLPGQHSTGHFGLAVPRYSHSTAPNRRFPDLITQRLAKAALAGGTSTYSIADLTALATHCTTQEDAAKKVERQLRKCAAAQLLSSRIGENFDAIVTGASDKGTWVRLLQPPAEGRLVSGDKGVDVGDQFKVKLVGLDVGKGFIDFTRSGK
jgi:exoribonuclease-2